MIEKKKKKKKKKKKNLYNLSLSWVSSLDEKFCSIRAVYNGL